MLILTGHINTCKAIGTHQGSDIIPASAITQRRGEISLQEKNEIKKRTANASMSSWPHCRHTERVKEHRLSPQQLTLKSSEIAGFFPCAYRSRQWNLECQSLWTHPNVFLVNFKSKWNSTNVLEFDELFPKTWNAFTHNLQNTVGIQGMCHIISQDCLIWD